MAVNLGIYSTNLSYASLFDQTQATLNYINAAKKMADGLEILDAIDEETIQRLEENINNRDIIIDIISETLLNSSSFLEDRGLQATSAIILVGGWVEGLYLATTLVPTNADIKKKFYYRPDCVKLCFILHKCQRTMQAVCKKYL